MSLISAPFSALFLSFRLVSPLRYFSVSFCSHAVVILLRPFLLRALSTAWVDFYRLLHLSYCFFVPVYFSLKQALFRSVLSVRMANLPDNAIQIILEMAAEEPATWEDAFAEGYLRIFRFLEWEG